MVYIKMNRPTLKIDGTEAATNFKVSTSLFLGHVYQRSRPKIDSLSLMKDERSENSEVWKDERSENLVVWKDEQSENSEVWKILVLRSKV